MTSLHKNIISFLIGSAVAYTFIWIVSFVAAMPVPELLQPYNEFVVSYYSNIATVCFAAILSAVIILCLRKAFTLFSKQNLFYFALPIVVFSVYLFVFMSFAATPLMYAAVPSVLVAFMLSKSQALEQSLN